LQKIQIVFPAGRGVCLEVAHKQDESVLSCGKILYSFKILFALSSVAR